MAKKFKILAASDLHGDTKAIKKLAELAEKEKVDLVVLAGDLTSFIETDNIIKPFIERNEKVVFLPGNWDSSETAAVLSKLYKIKDIGKYYARYDNVGIFGIGSPDWTMNLDEDKAFKKLKKDFDKVKDLEKKIMVSHLHAADTKAEFTGIPGSTA